MAFPIEVNHLAQPLQESSIHLKAGQHVLPGETIDLAQHWAELIQRNLRKADIISTRDGNNALPTETINDEVLNAPRRKSVRSELANTVAARLHPEVATDSLKAIIQYERHIVLLRRMVLDQRRWDILKATERNANRQWLNRIHAQSPWDKRKDPLSLNGAAALPMPVEVSDGTSLSPFFTHLRLNGTHKVESISISKVATAGTEPYYGTQLVEFEEGVLYSDGRMDLCKMVTGPPNIQNLMDSLKTNKFVKHFLLGNNIIGQTGARAIASFIDEYPDRFETWYLAGNCINHEGFSILVDRMIKSQAITNVWLKRNPLGPNAAQDVYRLIIGTRNLRTLDLDQTELGDAGVTSLFRSLATHNSDHPLALRHIYLNGVGIGEKACQQISRYLALPACTLESLYLSNNPIGDASTTLASGLRTNKSLKRLSMQSCGLNVTTEFLAALHGHASLQVLDLGQSYATEDLGMRFNWLTDVDSLIRLVQSTKLTYLNLSYVPIPQASLNRVLQAVITFKTLLWFQARTLFVKGTNDVESARVRQEGARISKAVRGQLHINVKRMHDGLSYERFENENKRFLVSPPDVRLIDSVYRNRDAGLARRGLRGLDKWWAEGDETLHNIQNSTLV